MQASREIAWKNSFVDPQWDRGAKLSSLPYTRGPKVGFCNICGEHGKLTEDHVPPKGVARFRRMQLHNVIDALGVERDPRKGRKFQNGVKFRSICVSCNSDLLGGLYDPELVNFANGVSSYLYSQVSLPPVGAFSVKPGYVAKAVMGHILALGVEQIPRGEIGDAMASSVLDSSAEIPPEVNIYYWLYPYWHQVSIRAFSFLVRPGVPPVLASLLKFTPLAFLLVWDLDDGIHVPYFDLKDYILGSGSSEADVPLNFSVVPPPHYPEAPTDKGITLHGQDSYIASIDRKSERRKN